MTPAHRPSRASRAFRALLRLLPSEFRRDFGDEMSEVFDASHVEASGQGRVATGRLWARTIRGVVGLAPREHLSILVRDAGYALRLMRRQPGITAAAVVTMALGIGANTAMFSVVEAVLYGLPFKEPARVYRIATDTKPGPQPPAITASMLQSWAGAPGFDAIAGFSSERRLVADGEVESVIVEIVSAPMFRVLGVTPAVGRTFDDSEDSAGAPAVIVLSDHWWHSHFAGDPTAIGRTIVMNDTPVTVIGVMRPDFAGPFARDGVAGWAPLGTAIAKLRAARRQLDPNVNVFARVSAGVSIKTALAPLDAAVRGAAGKADPSARVAAIPIAEQITGDIAPTLLSLWGAAGFVLLIACANVAGLLLGRVDARQAEMALRTALGSTRSRLVRQLLTESVVLGAAGGALGIVLALWLLPPLVALMPAYVPNAGRIGLDSRVLTLSALASLVTGLMFGLLPALKTSRRAPGITQRRAVTGSRGRQWTRMTLVAAEIGMSLAVLVGAGLLVRTFLHLRPDSPGFATAGRLVVDVNLPRLRYPSETSRVVFYDDLGRRLAATPGVVGVTAASALPLSGYGDVLHFVREGADPSAAPARVRSSEVIPNFFSEMEIPVLKGRAFAELDRGDSAPVVIVNDDLAHRLAIAGPVLGARLVVTDDTGAIATRTVVGVVGNTRMSGGSVEMWPVAYLPLSQTTGYGREFVVRTGRSIAEITPAIREAIRSVDPRLPVGSISAMADDVSRQVAGWRFAAWLMTSFAGLAGALAGVGVFAIVGWSVAERTREIGIRMALGASGATVLREILGRALLVTAAGLVAGIALALATSKMLSDLLVDVSPFDTRSFLLGVGAMAVLSLVAAYVPARRALDVDPLIALRAE